VVGNCSAEGDYFRRDRNRNAYIDYAINLFSSHGLGYIIFRCIVSLFACSSCLYELASLFPQSHCSFILVRKNSESIRAPLKCSAIVHLYVSMHERLEKSQNEFYENLT
jgi:hypothetical protein